MFVEKKTYIQSPRFSETYRADVENVDNVELITTLGNLSNVNIGIGKRSEVRVQTAAPISINLRDQTGYCSLNGQISDISQDGLGLFVAWMTMVPRFFPAGAPVLLTYQLPGVFVKIQTKPFVVQETRPLDRFATEKTRFSTTSSRNFQSGYTVKDSQSTGQFLNPTIHVQAEVANIYQEHVFNRFRIGLRVENNAQQEQIISKYIGQRQTEIIQEIREQYLAMRKSRGTSSI
ncbi:MAG: PilZ domain-containing protein [Anaerolineaceae bacterium]